MRIKEIREGVNWLTLIFYDECGKDVLKKVLQHAKYANKLYYYVIFGDSLHTTDLSPYFKHYPELDMDYGMFQLRMQDLNNVDLIYDILNQYHSCNLYINQDPDFMQRNSGKIWRDAPIVTGGYSIDMLADYIQIVQMSDDLPAWKPLINEFELIKQVNLEFPVFILEAMDNCDCDEMKLQSVIANEKNFGVVRKDLANSNHYARKLLVDSGGSVYRIMRAHVVDEPFLANVIKSFFHSINEERVYVEFEFEDETANISFEEFKKLVISILEDRNAGRSTNRSYNSLHKRLVNCTSFRAMAALIVKKRMARNKWV